MRWVDVTNRGWHGEWWEMTEDPSYVNGVMSQTMNHIVNEMITLWWLFLADSLVVIVWEKYYLGCRDLVLVSWRGILNWIDWCKYIKGLSQLQLSMVGWRRSLTICLLMASRNVFTEISGVGGCNFNIIDWICLLAMALDVRELTVIKASWQILSLQLRTQSSRIFSKTVNRKL